MFEKNMRYAFLLDLYGSVLDEHSRTIMTAYYEDDLSLAEIAEGENISRQGVRHIIKKSEEQLDFLEDKLALAEHYSKLDDLFAQLTAISAELDKKGDATLSDISARIAALSDKFNK